MSPILPNREKSLLDSIRKACSTPVWRQGHKLAAAGLVECLDDNDEAMEFSIRLPGMAQNPTAVLYLKDADWECDCASKSDNCAHVAAAVIALTTAKKDSEGSPILEVSKTSLEYRFSTTYDGFVLKRFVRHPAGLTPITMPMVRGVASELLPKGFRPSIEDLQADQLIAPTIAANKALPPRIMVALIPLLAEKKNIFLNGALIEISDEPLFPDIALSNHEDNGVAVLITRNEDIEDIPAPMLTLSAGRIHEMGEPGICGLRCEKLPRTIVYEHGQLAELVSSILPQLESETPLKITTNRLPIISPFVRPRISMDIRQNGKVVSVKPTLVYGDPSQVRIEKDIMIFLEGTVPIRDRIQERDLVTNLRDDFNMVPGRRVSFSGKDAVHFIEKVRNWTGYSAEATEPILGNEKTLIPRVMIKDNLFDISFDLPSAQNSDEKILKGDINEAYGLNVIRAWQEGLSLIPLEGGGFANVPQQWLEDHGALVADILESRAENKTIPPAAIPMLADLCNNLNMPPQPCFKEIAPIFEAFDSIPQVPLPGDLQATLRPYQREGINWLGFLKTIKMGALLADDMGLGKTLQALCAMEGKCLVVCPTSVLHNWQIEIDRFRPGLPYFVYHGPNRKLPEDSRVVLTTYGLLRIDRKILINTDWDCVVLDEAQNIKNPASQVAKAAYQLNGKFRIALSGTPVENRLDEIWSIFNFTNRGLLGGRSGFQRRFSVPITMGDQETAANLRKRISPFVLRRLKKEVEPDLPKRTDQILNCELQPDERTIYDAIKIAANNEIVSQLGKGITVMAALEMLLRLRQASCHPSLVPGQTAPSSSKVDLLMQQLDHSIAAGHRALVFSQWTSFLDLIEPHLKRSNISFNRLDGSTRDRRSVVETFQAPDGPSIMLISLKAGGTGLNLTAADHVYIMDPWWNPAVEDQAADRTHRIGQDKPVMVYKLATTDTVEEKILALQNKKRKIADAALSDAAKALSITREDLMELLT